MTSFLQVVDLIAGDVLLYRSNTWIGRAIRFFDRAEVNHAGLYLGADLVGEALPPDGLKRTRLRESIAGSDWVAVSRLKWAPGTMQPVLDAAAAYLDQGNRYAYGQILLLALVCLTRKLDLSRPVVRRIVSSAIHAAAALVRRLQSQGQQPMICSEFVYRAYDEAVPGPDDPYSIALQPLWPLAGPRLVFRRRRQRNVSAAANIHAESLLGRFQAEPGGLVLDESAGGASAEPSPVGEADLDALIAAFLAEELGGGSPSSLAAAAGEEVALDELRHAVSSLAAALHEATDGGLRLAHGAGAAPPARAPSPAHSLLEISADLVTPGDLLRSASLRRVGDLRP